MASKWLIGTIALPAKNISTGVQTYVQVDNISALIPLGKYNYTIKTNGETFVLNDCTQVSEIPDVLPPIV